MKNKIVLLTLITYLLWGCREAPLVLQALDYTENPVDIPNPDRGPFRGRWQRGETPFGITPEVDHRVPVDENSVLYHGRQLPPVEGDDIEETSFYNGVNLGQDPYVGGTGVSALPSISFMGFDLVNFSSNAFLSRQASYDFFNERQATGALNFEGRTGKTQPLTDFALDYIRNLLQKVREGNGVAFVKFSYDGNGFNYLERWTGYREQLIYGPEPIAITPNNPSDKCSVPGHEDKDWIQYHIWQLTPIFHEFEDVIMCVKTGMFGPWGEQHSSPIAQSSEAYKKLFDAYLDAVPASRMLLTHPGGFLAWYNGTYGTSYNFTNIHEMPVPPKGSPEARFGVFDDSYAASYDDNGSLSEGSTFLGQGFNRSNVFTWINKQNSILQGEGGIGDNVYGNFPGAVIEAQEMRTTALNMRHGNYQRWKDFIYTEEVVTTPVTFEQTKIAYFDPAYDGRTGLEYFRDRMGYRLVLREANVSEWVKQNGTLRFEGKIQNVGFGNVVNKKNVWVILKSKSGSDTYTALTNLDARDWLTDENGNGRPDNTAAWRDLNFSVDMHLLGNVPAGEYDIYLKINDPKERSANKRCIQFANRDSWNAGLGANLMGSTIVK